MEAYLVTVDPITVLMESVQDQYAFHYSYLTVSVSLVKRLVIFAAQLKVPVPLPSPYLVIIKRQESYCLMEKERY